MLSEEERMAIEHLKNYPINWLIENVNESAIKIVLNLIEKQQKEIEELKEKDDANLAYYDQIYQNGIYTGQKAVEDKIKARIKELEEYLYKGNIRDDFLMIRIKAKIQELQSLLEKE